MTRCKLCNLEDVKVETDLFDFPTVTSDCRPWLKGRAIMTCKSCNLTQRILLPEVENTYDSIYEGYEIFKHAKAASDQLNFGDDGVLMGRTQKVLNFLVDKFKIDPKRILDIGSGSGSGLNALAEKFPKAEIYGFEPNDRPEERQKALSSNVRKIFSERPVRTSAFELITLFHVLEHVEQLDDLLGYIKAALSNDGSLIIEVPYPHVGPFDYAVADHIWHFSKTSLFTILGRAGFAVQYIGNDVIRKELTVLANKNEHAGKQEQLQLVESDAEAIQWFKNYKSFLDEVKLNYKNLFIYGTGPAAAWAAQILGDAVMAFAEDDTERVGSHFNGKPVVSPMSLDREIPIIAVFPDYQCDIIKKKNTGLNFIVRADMPNFV